MNEIAAAELRCNFAAMMAIKTRINRAMYTLKTRIIADKYAAAAAI